jgi:four helix bundle protein
MAGISDFTDLLVWKRAIQFCALCHELRTKTEMKHDRLLCDALNSTCVSMMTNIPEGFSQNTYRAFARYLCIARVSTNEARGQIATGLSRGYYTQEKHARADIVGCEVAKMLTALIGHRLLAVARIERPDDLRRSVRHVPDED